MNWLDWTKFSLLLATQILPLLQQIEEMIGKGKGEVKKGVATAIIENAAPGDMNDQQKAKVSKLIDGAVGQLNAAGVFQK